MAGEKQKKTTSKVGGKTPSKSSSKAPSKTASRASSKTTSKAAGKTVSKTDGKAADKVASKGVKTRHPAPKEKEDGQAFTDRMEQSLLELKSELVENLIANNKDFKEIVEGIDPKDLADIASDDIDRKMIEALGSQEHSRLRLIESALTRIKQGKYGVCIKCSKRIPQKRLEAIPYALMCIECKSEEERRNR